MDNYMKLEIAARGENESFARSAVAAFALTLCPSLTELADIKTAVSEAVTNCIVHAYNHDGSQKILLECQTQKTSFGGFLHIVVTDYGCGIADVERAIEPFYTTLTENERSGMGFTIMQTFTDEFSVSSARGKGTTVRMLKKIGADFAVDENLPIKERLNA